MGIRSGSRNRGWDLTRSRMLLGIVSSLILVLLALGVGFFQHRILATLPLMGTSILLEAQPGVAASIALGFHPLAGAAISILSNLIAVPWLLLTFHEVVTRWRWARNKIERAKKLAGKYGKYGVGALAFLSPFLGAYVSIALGFAMGWRIRNTVALTMVGMLTSVLIIAYGGHWVVHLFSL